jgi:hypothetical protein
MTPKEKAEELVEKYAELASRFGQATEWEYDKQCAIICVDELIEALEHNLWQNKDWINHYKEVKQEIEKL